MADYLTLYYSKKIQPDHYHIPRHLTSINRRDAVKFYRCPSHVSISAFENASQIHIKSLLQSSVGHACIKHHRMKVSESL